MPHPLMLELIEGLKAAQDLPNGDLHCAACGHRGFSHQHLGPTLGACTQCACKVFERFTTVRESAAEVMDGELRVGQVSKNLAAGPTLSEVFAEDDDDGA